MFASSHSVPFLEYFRIPYQVAGRGSAPTAFQVPPGHPLGAAASLTATRNPQGPHLYWLPAPQTAPKTGSDIQEPYLVGSIPVFGDVASDELIGEPLRAQGWDPLLTVLRPNGSAHGSVWQHPDGSLLLPFDAGQLVANFWSERYHQRAPGGAKSAVMGLARRGYYRLRPLLPRNVQIRLRQRFTNVQGRSTFPRWPVESALHDLYDLMFELLSRIAGERVPYVSLWPRGHRWALVLTHDVETTVGYEHLHLLRDLESSLGLRSSWNFVPRRYETDHRTVQSLRDAGFEVGVHGLYHDGRDFGSLSLFRQRLPAVHDYARRWGAVGFRSPALHRVWDWMRELEFDYDSSYPDTDPYQPMPGGCCSVLPFHNGQLVELPITLAQDFVLFDLLEHRDEALWVEKLDYIRHRGGMALFLTHPDYMLEAGRRAAYERVLTGLAVDETAWRALPSEVAGWWRRRHASWLEQRDGSWFVAGPAAEEGHVAFAAASRAGSLPDVIRARFSGGK